MRLGKTRKMGGAEYLDLLRAVDGLYDDAKAQHEALERLRVYTLRKHPEEPQW